MRRVPGASGLADGRRDRAHAVPAVRHPPASARMGYRRRRRRSAAGSTCWASTARMAGASSSALLALPVAWLSGHGTWPVAAPFAAALVRLAGGRALGQPVAAGRWRPPVSAADDAQALRLIARRTWRFFETFVTAADNMLPPDNFQEDPEPVVAHRTSPTNIGLYLLSVASARDFGWIGTIEAVERLEATLGDHGAPRPLPRPFLQLVRHARPASARSALRLLGRQRQSGRTSDRARQRLPRVERHGATPTQRLCRDRGCARPCARSDGRSCATARRTQTVTWHQLDDESKRLPPACVRRDAERRHRCSALAELCAQAGTMADIGAARSPANEGDDAGADLLFWAEAARRSIESHRRDVGQSPDAAAALAARLAGARSNARDRWPWQWSSAFCSIPSASCFRSAIGVPTARSTRAATTCSPPRRGSPASSRSPRATCRRATGSGWAAR